MVNFFSLEKITQEPCDFSRGRFRIDKKDIEKAKEKLGNQNALLMAELLELDKFDEKNLKACCPYHKEDTPSFIYNKKNYTFHCFGCGRTVDVIDVLMEKGNTFLDATKFLFDKAKIEYSFGEQNVKTKRDYVYPHEEPLNSRENVIEYLGKRSISKNVIDYLDIREDYYGNIVFNYFDTNDVLTMVKYRPSHTVVKGENKQWAQTKPVKADTTPLLFNMNRVNNSKPLIITEGEIDTASVIEAGYLNTVSIPFGASDRNWIEQNLDWLDTFDEIIIWSDNDEPGITMRKDCMYRLGTWRTKYIETPPYFEKENGKRVKLKDVNDCLQVGGKDFVMKLISNAKDIPVKGVTNFSKITPLDIRGMDGIKIGLKPLEDELIKIYYGTLTIISGRPGSGKTSIMDQLIGNAIDEDKPVFLFSKEMPGWMQSDWLVTTLAGRRHLKEMTSKNGKPYNVVPYNKTKEIQEFYNEKLWVCDDEEPNDVDYVMGKAEECVRKYGCKLIVLDNLMMIDLHCNSSENNNAQTDFINRLIRFASKFNVAVLLCAHPKKIDDESKDVGMYDVAGSSNILNLAMRSISMRKVSDEEKNNPKSKWKNYDVVIKIMKDRLFGKSEIRFGLWYDRNSRRFYSNYDEYDYKFRWDQNTYTDRLPYEDRSKQVDEFPDK